jgi:hypothetical protein
MVCNSNECIGCQVLILSNPSLRIGARKQMKIPYKRPSTSWQNFYRDYLKDHMEPGDTYTAYAAEASALWKAMSAEDKAACTPSIASLLKDSLILV